MPWQQGKPCLCHNAIIARMNAPESAEFTQNFNAKQKADTTGSILTV